MEFKAVGLEDMIVLCDEDGEIHSHYDGIKELLDSEDDTYREDRGSGRKIIRQECRFVEVDD
ncbi:uncharacterized protein LY89DRAFT_679696 [Mollisia scopiformis]|uniref:Uncharacterized protein n=1 Tax=Mollisia scopiformis TaxID=149040 RepID=A0A194XX15_MOLSC|nr:uncharacterized protein LY89DRAFT_679696 [Mollisia scopiformis]KUJ24609.1 hypothetical protein LY89DRAFT_679696 [Mollisia scopiformis]